MPALLAFAALVITRAIQARRNRGPGLSLRGVIIGLALLAITLPTLLISITAGQQLQRAVEQGVLDGLKTINLAVSRVGPGQRTNQLLIEQLGGCKVSQRAGRKSDRERSHDQKIEDLLALCVFFDGLANTISKSGKGIERATKILARVLGAPK